MELANAFKSKFKLLKKKPHKRVLKKFIHGSKKSIISNTINSMNHSSESSTASTKEVNKNHDTPDININKRRLLGDTNNSFHNKGLSVNTVLEAPLLTQKALSTQCSSSTFKQQHERRVEKVVENLKSPDKPLERIGSIITESKVVPDSDDRNMKIPTTEQIIAQSMAELARINEENSISDNTSGFIEDPSPKISVGITDTWGKNGPNVDDS